MAGLDIDILCESGNWPDGLEPEIVRVLNKALEMSGRALDGPAELSVVLTDDAHQQALNAQWRDKDKPTNVLSFPQIAPAGPVLGLLGDIIVAHETVLQEAQSLDIDFKAHLMHLVVHGMLHILGYDHQTDEQALVMEARETDIMISLGYGDPYTGQDLDLDAIGR